MTLLSMPNCLSFQFLSHLFLSFFLISQSGLDLWAWCPTVSVWFLPKLKQKWEKKEEESKKWKRSRKIDDEKVVKRVRECPKESLFLSFPFFIDFDSISFFWQDNSSIQMFFRAVFLLSIFRIQPFILSVISHLSARNLKNVGHPKKCFRCFGKEFEFQSGKLSDIENSNGMSD